MVLVCGGAFQGKVDFILNEKNIQKDYIIDFEKIFLNDELKNTLSLDNLRSNSLYDLLLKNQLNPILAFNLSEAKYIIFDNFECLVRYFIENKLNIDSIYSFVDDLLKFNKNEFIIVSDSVSNCLVPINPIDRMFREELSRVVCYISKKSNEVYRVFVGIGEKIK